MNSVKGKHIGIRFDGGIVNSHHCYESEITKNPIFGIADAIKELTDAGAKVHIVLWDTVRMRWPDRLMIHKKVKDYLIQHKIKFMTIDDVGMKDYDVFIAGNAWRFDGVAIDMPDAVAEVLK